MCAMRLPGNQRGQGLEERSGAGFIGLDAASLGLSPACEDGDLHELSPAEWVRMTRQVEIASRFGAIIERVAVRYGLLPSTIAGFCSRRSGWGLDLSPTGIDGTRDYQRREVMVKGRQSVLPPDGLGFQRGLMGLDFDRHPVVQEGDWRDPERNMDAAFTLIADHRIALRRRKTLQGVGLLRASMTAFECSLGAVERAIRRGLDVDSPTSDRLSIHRGCGQDVLARAAFFQARGWD